MDVYLNDIARFFDEHAAGGKDWALLLGNVCAAKGDAGLGDLTDDVSKRLENYSANALDDAIKVKHDTRVNRERANDLGSNSRSTKNATGKVPDDEGDFCVRSSPTEGHGQKKRHTRQLRLFLHVIWGFLVAGCVIYCLEKVDQIWPAGTYRLCSEADYQAMRFSRKLLHRLNILTNYSLIAGECIISNPFFRNYSQCARCLAIEELRNQTRRKKFTRLDFDRDTLSAPIILKNSSSGVTLDMLRSSFFDHLDDLEPQYGKGFLSSILEIQHVQDLADRHNIDRMVADGEAIITWVTQHQPSLKVLRALFPKQRDIPGDLYQSRKMVFIMFGRAKNYKFDSFVPTKFMYTQGLGSTTLLLNPERICLNGCKPFMIQLDPGDVVVFDSMVWQWELALLTDSTSAMSVGLLERVVSSQGAQKTVQ
ncbi:unnamed protein product [Lymnaea stagnalis]|uniref:Uncharacterized protein n=1 Tax=Lymnaea stagnalis TaxID=6523 RepID=A0AAV2IB49_LYMST